MTIEEQTSGPIGRREALTLFGGAGLVALAAACGSSSDTATPPTTAGGTASTTGAPSTTAAPGSSSTSAATATTASGASCMLAPELTQGPYFLTDHPNTSDLVQDRPGVPLELVLTVVDLACRPIADAKVDIWHCDAVGTYGGIGSGAPGGGPGGPGGRPGGPSGAATGGTTAGGMSGADGAATRGTPDNWLQGWQTSDGDGQVTFRTIYPGWYPGRAVHIHLKVGVGNAWLHTGQLFFPGDLSSKVFATAPYEGDPDMPNEQDSIFRDAGAAAMLAPTADGTGYRAEAQLVVQS